MKSDRLLHNFSSLIYSRTFINDARRQEFDFQRFAPSPPSRSPRTPPLSYKLITARAPRQEREGSDEKTSLSSRVLLRGNRTVVHPPSLAHGDDVGRPRRRRPSETILPRRIYIGPYISTPRGSVRAYKYNINTRTVLESEKTP